MITFWSNFDYKLRLILYLKDNIYFNGERVTYKDDFLYSLSKKEVLVLYKIRLHRFSLNLPILGHWREKKDFCEGVCLSVVVEIAVCKQDDFQKNI